MCNYPEPPPPSLWELVKRSREHPERNQNPHVEVSFVITHENVKACIELAQDTNPIHADETIAKRCGFKDIIVPGLFFGLRISGLVARNFPDGVLAESIQLKFRRPSYVGDTVTLRLLFTSASMGVAGSEKIFLDFSVKNQLGKLVSDGSCVVIVRPDDDK